MRVFMVMLMLLVLPLQFSAAAAVQCSGRLVVEINGQQGPHHQPADQSVVRDAADQAASSLGFGLDCGTCHANCAAAVMATAALMVDRVGTELMAHLFKLALPSWQELPYRPQWCALSDSGPNAFS